MKNRKLKSISHKLIVAFLIVIISVIALIWLIQALMLKTSYSWFRERQIHSVIEEVKEITKNSFDTDKLDALSTENDCIIYVLDENLNNVYVSSESEPKGLLKEITKATNEIKIHNIDKDITLTKSQVDYNIHGEKIGEYYIVLVSRLAPVEATSQVIINQLKVISIIAILISIGIAIIIAKKISKPIQETSNKAIELSKENFNVSFDHYEYIEIKELSDTLNKASKELKEKNEIKKEVIANVSHDLKTPLSIIKGYCEMIQDITGDNKEKRNEQLQKIQKETNNLTLMINDMLDLSKLDNNTSLDMQEFDLSKLILETIDRLDGIIKKEEIQVIYEPKEAKVVADRAKIGQVLYNLIANAINFVGNDKKVIINQIAENNITKIEIIDNGIGIDEKDLPYIFDRYYKTNDKYRKSGISTGLGLSIVKKILEQHECKYGVESEKGKGTKFWFEIKNKN